MKNKICILITVIIVLTSLLCLPISAAEGDLLSISEDYQSATYNGKLFIRIDDSYTISQGERSIAEDHIELTEEQSLEISTVYANVSDRFLSVELNFNKGGYAIYTYIDSAYIDEFEAFINGSGDEFVFYREYYGNSVDIKHDMLFGEEITMKGYQISYYDLNSNSVYTMDESNYYQKECGNIFKDENGEYYYVDYYQFGPEYAKSFDPSEHETVTVWKITDQSLISKLNVIFIEIELDDYDSETPTIMLVLCAFVLCVALGVLPLIAFVLCLSFSFKAKAPYNKLLLISTIILAIEIISFVITVILFSVL